MLKPNRSLVSFYSDHPACCVLIISPHFYVNTKITKAIGYGAREVVVVKTQLLKASKHTNLGWDGTRHDIIGESKYLEVRQFHNRFWDRLVQFVLPVRLLVSVRAY